MWHYNLWSGRHNTPLWSPDGVRKTQWFPFTSSWRRTSTSLTRNAGKHLLEPPCHHLYRTRWHDRRPSLSFQIPLGRSGQTGDHNYLQCLSTDLIIWPAGGAEPDTTKLQHHGSDVVYIHTSFLYSICFTYSFYCISIPPICLFRSPTVFTHSSSSIFQYSTSKTQWM